VIVKYEDLPLRSRIAAMLGLPWKLPGVDGEFRRLRRSLRRRKKET